jgi:hypothetical protein
MSQVLESTRLMRFGQCARLLILAILGGCSQQPRDPLVVPANSKSSIRDITAVAFSSDAKRLWVASDNGETCKLSVLHLPGRTLDAVRDLVFCPTVMVADADGSLRLIEGTVSLHLDPAGAVLPNSDSTDVRSARKLRGTGATVGIRRNDRGEALVKVEAALQTQLTPDFSAIDSFDLAPSEKEIVISADAGKGLNVGLLSIDGGEIRWIFPDSLPERVVSWAPRGSKISYVVEALGGSIIRTVHIPTSYQLSIDFPLSHITSIAWEPSAEKFAVSLSSADRAPRVDLMRYGGEDRETIFGGTAVSQNIVDRVGEAVVVMPRVTRYGQRQPLVVWVARESPFAWNDARSRVSRDSDAGIAIVPPSAVSASLWPELLSLPWVDKDRVFIVFNHLPANEPIMPQGVAVTVIRPAENRRAIGRGKQSTVLVPGGRPEIPESFAVEYILGKLQKRK